MKKYSFFIVLALLFLALIVALVYVFKANALIYEGESNVIEESETNQSQSTSYTPLQWQDKLAKLKAKDYAPAAEYFSMVFTPDTSAFAPKNKYYQLLIDKNDIYSLFCLKQTLNFFEVKYSLIHTGEETKIFLDTDNKTLLEDIKKRLLVYDIHTEIKEIWL